MGAVMGIDVAMSLPQSHEFDRFMIVIDTTLTATTIIQLLKSRSTIRTVDLTMSTAPQFFTNAHDFTMINPVISNYQYVGGECPRYSRRRIPFANSYNSRS
jgi:hypothetical protein